MWENDHTKIMLCLFFNQFLDCKKSFLIIFLSKNFTQLVVQLPYRVAQLLYRVAQLPYRVVCVPLAWQSESWEGW